MVRSRYLELARENHSDITGDETGDEGDRIREVTKAWNFYRNKVARQHPVATIEAPPPVVKPILLLAPASPATITDAPAVRHRQPTILEMEMAAEANVLLTAVLSGEASTLSEDGQERLDILKAANIANILDFDKPWTQADDEIKSFFSAISKEKDVIKRLFGYTPTTSVIKTINTVLKALGLSLEFLKTLNGKTGANRAYKLTQPSSQADNNV